MGQSTTQELLGRAAECGVIDTVLGAATHGSFGVVVVRGDPGVGKTALLDWAAAAAALRGAEVLRIVGVEADVHLAFAGVHALLVPLIGELAALPTPQQLALRTVFGEVTGKQPDRFLVGLGMLTLLAGRAQSRPVCCVVDDAHWLDEESLQVLAFVCRRLHADPVAMVFGTRPGTPMLDGLPTLELGGLPDAAARALVRARAGSPISRSVEDRLVSEARGNPLALWEVAGALSIDQLAGAATLPEPLPVGDHLRERYVAQALTLPPPTREFLVLVAANVASDPGVLWRAATILDLDPTVADPALAAGILLDDSALGFRHPLIRSAVYGAAAPAARRRVHRALAEGSSDPADVDRRAWHHAAAVAGTDDDVASDLARAAGRARQRGGFVSEVVFLERAADLSSSPNRRSEYLLAAARTAIDAAEPESARRLLDRVAPDLYSPTLRAEAGRISGLLSAFTNHGSVASTLVEAAGTLRHEDLAEAQLVALEALEAMTVSRHMTGGLGQLEVANRAAALVDDGADGVVAEFVAAFAAVWARGQEAAVPSMRSALETLEREGSPAQASRWYRMAIHAGQELWDPEVVRAWTERGVAEARADGALNRLRVALSALASVELQAGRFAEAVSLHEETLEISRAAGLDPAPLKVMGMEMMAWQGRDAETRAIVEAILPATQAMRCGALESLGLWSLAILDLASGRYDDAFASLVRAIHPPTVGFANLARFDLVEAAARSGRPEVARTTLDDAVGHALASGTPWALGLVARSEALLADDDEADSYYNDAIASLERTPVRTDLARAHLLYGEWLRRVRRRRDARTELRAAHEMFLEMGAAGFANRARTELLATGEHARQRSVATTSDLTPQEAQIARMAASGSTNPEIATQLFISASTVEYHLRKVFQKLGVTSRRELSSALPELLVTEPAGAE